MRSGGRWFTLVALVLLASTGALAAPPLAEPSQPHGPVDPCTVASYEETDVACELCPRDASGAECARRLEGLGYVKKCETRHEIAAHGAVYCKSKRAAVASSPEPESEQTRSALRLIVLVAAAALAGVVLYSRRDVAKRRS